MIISTFCKLVLRQVGKRLRVQLLKHLLSVSTAVGIAVWLMRRCRLCSRLHAALENVTGWWQLIVISTHGNQRICWGRTLLTQPEY